jgi:hypothetical protein
VFKRARDWGSESVLPLKIFVGIVDKEWTRAARRPRLADAKRGGEATLNKHHLTPDGDIFAPTE